MLNRLLKYFGYVHCGQALDLREIVVAFGMEMDGEISANNYRPDWRDASAAYLMECAFDNCQQLTNELAYKPRPEGVRKHAADAANYLMFVAANWGELLPRSDGLSRAMKALEKL